MKALALTVFVNTLQVNDLHTDGDLLYAATSGGVEVYDRSGERLAHWVEGLPAEVNTVGRHRGRLTVGVAEGAFAWEPLPAGGSWVPLAEEEVPDWALPLDLATQVQALLAVAPDQVQLAHLGPKVVAPLGNELAVGTDEGLFLVGDEGIRRITPEGQICGSFVTGATRWLGRIVVGTFDRGACILEDDGWHRIESLPTEMINDVQADGSSVWIATSDGLFQWNGHHAQRIPEELGTTHRNSPAIHHKSVNGLARGDRMWITDVVGPVSVDDAGRWSRYRRSVWGRSYQDIAACGGEAWVASEDAGVSWTDGSQWRHFDASTGLPDDWIMAVACDGVASAWAGTYQDGVWEMRGGKFQKLGGLPDDWILALDWGLDSLWVGTMGGLFVREQGFQAIEGLPHPAVHDLTAGNGEVLVGTEGGLVVLKEA